MKKISFYIFCCFFVSLQAVSQIKPLKQTPVPNSVLKTNTSQTVASQLLSPNTLTPQIQKIEGLAEFTYKGADYDEASKKLVIHGCVNLTPIPCFPAPCNCVAAVQIKVLNTTNAQFRIDAIVSYDKNYYKDVPLVDFSKVPDGNNYFYSAAGPDTYRDPLSGSNVKIPIAKGDKSNAGSVQKLTLFIKQKADGKALTNEDYKNIEIKLSADYAFELRSITVTPM